MWLHIGIMQTDYDKSRWVELLKRGTLEDVRHELAQYPKHFLLSLTDSSTSRQTCLFHAIQGEDEARGNLLLELLLTEGADACYKDVLNQTAVFYAARFGHEQQLQMLLNGGASPNDKDTYGQTPIYYAAREGFHGCIKRLIAAGADVNATDNLGQTALFYAAREGRMESTRVLVENGANINQCDRSKLTPLSWARKSSNEELIAFLISSGAEDRAQKKKEEAPRKREEKPAKKKSEKKVKCQLMVVDAVGDKRPATAEELADFEEKHPDIAKYWKDPSLLEELDQVDPESLETLRPWEKPGKKLMNALWRANNAWIFHEPVDPVKLNIPDYFDIVKKPMDFSTIKKKLNNNAYHSGEDFLTDVELVFNNCRAYNQPSTDVHIMCNSIFEVYQAQVKVLGLEAFLPQPAS